MLSIGWFSTGRDEAARQLLQAVQESIGSGDIDGIIRFVFSNRESGESQESDLLFQLVQGYGIPLICLSHRKFKTLIAGQGGQSRPNWRLKYDREVDQRIEGFRPDICVLAGYMLIVGRELCHKYNMINLHPAPPHGPVGSWQQVIHKLIQTRARDAGAMIHLVTPQLDRGPVVSYCRFSLEGEPFDRYWREDNKAMLFELIRQYELAREFPLIILTLQALSRGKIVIADGKVVDAQGREIDGCDLTEEIDRAVEGKTASFRSQ